MNDDDPIELYRCTECGKLSVDLGWLHGHIEGHRGYGWGPIRLSNPFKLGDPEYLLSRTEVLRVDEVTVIDPATGEEVEA